MRLAVITKRRKGRRKNQKEESKGRIKRKNER